MKQEIFRGIATALATPMDLDGTIDYEAYGRLIDWQIESGVAGLVACGTTGESATMAEAEHKEVIRFTVERAAGRVPVIAGTGSNCTAKAVAMTQYACSVGASACLLVTPYYNKAPAKSCARRSLWTPLWQVLRPAYPTLHASDKRMAA